MLPEKNDCSEEYAKMNTKSLLILLAFLVLTSPAMASNKFIDMFAKGSLKGHLRYYNFHYDGEGETSQSLFPTHEDAGDSVGAVLLAYKTDALYGVSFAATLTAAVDLWTDEDLNGYGMLQDSHESFNKFMEYYIQGDWFDTTIKYGAQEFYTPLLNQDYCRILPNTYRGVTLVNRTVKNLQAHAYYITDFMGWTDDEYNDIGEQSGPHGLHATVTDNPMIVLGGSYALPMNSLNINLEGWGYFMEDVYDTEYFRVNFNKKIGDYDIHFMPSIMLQKTEDGAIDNPFTSSTDNIETYEAGFEAGVTTPWGVFSKAYFAKTGDDYQVIPFGFGSIVMQQLQVSGRRGDENAYGMKVGYDFGKVGVPGLSAYIWYVLYDAPADSESDLGEYEGEITEIDYNIRYSFKQIWPGPFGDIFVELGYAQVSRELAGDIDDIRFRLNFPFSLNGR